MVAVIYKRKRSFVIGSVASLSSNLHMSKIPAKEVGSLSPMMSLLVPLTILAENFCFH